MSGAKELEVLAERYLDLWERQLAAMTDDPAGLERFAAFAAAFGQAVFGAAIEEPPRAPPEAPDAADSVG